MSRSLLATSSFVIPRDSIQHIDDNIQQVLQKEYHVQAVLSPIQTPWKKKRKEVSIMLKALSYWPQFVDAKKYLKSKLPPVQPSVTAPCILAENREWREETVEMAPGLCGRLERTLEIAGIVNSGSKGSNGTGDVKENSPAEIMPSVTYPPTSVFQNKPHVSSSGFVTEISTPAVPDVSKSSMKKLESKMQSPALSVEVLNVNPRVNYILPDTPKRVEKVLTRKQSKSKAQFMDDKASESADSVVKNSCKSIEVVFYKEMTKSKVQNHKQLKYAKYKRASNRKVQLLGSNLRVTVPDDREGSRESLPDVIEISDEEMDKSETVRQNGVSPEREDFSFTLEGGNKSGDISEVFTFKLAPKSSANKFGVPRRPLRFSSGLSASTSKDIPKHKATQDYLKQKSIATETSDIDIILPDGSGTADKHSADSSDVFIVSPGNSENAEEVSENSDVHVISSTSSRKRLRPASASSDIHIITPEDPDVQCVPGNRPADPAGYVEIVKVVSSETSSKVACIQTVTPEDKFGEKKQKKKVRQKLLCDKTQKRKSYRRVKTFSSKPSRNSRAQASDFLFERPSCLLPLPLDIHMPAPNVNTQGVGTNTATPVFSFSMPQQVPSSLSCLPKAGLELSRRLDARAAAPEKTTVNGLRFGPYGTNIYIPDWSQTSNRRGLRPVVIDGSNVAMAHGKHITFSCRGIAICVDYFLKRGHKEVKVFVPQFRKKSGQATDPHLLEKLERTGHIVFTPSRTIQNRTISCYDDRFIVQYAASCGGVVVSRDNYRDLLQEDRSWWDTIENRLLMYTWVGDTLMFPQDPLGRRGPSLDEFLSFPKK